MTREELTQLFVNWGNAHKATHPDHRVWLRFNWPGDIDALCQTCLESPMDLIVQIGSASISS